MRLERGPIVPQLVRVADDDRVRIADVDDVTSYPPTFSRAGDAYVAQVLAIDVAA